MVFRKKAGTRKFVRRPRRKFVRKPKIPRGTLLYKGQPGIADRALIKMKYRDNYTLTAPAPATWAQYAWRMNSIYDPDRTGGGHQPLTYDQWNLFYLSYRVYKVDVEINLANQEVVAAQVLWTVQPDDYTLTYDDSAYEQPHTYSKILGGVNGQNRATIKRTLQLPRYIGMTPTQYKSNPNLSALFGYNPNSSIYGILYASSIDDAAVPNISVNVNLVFHVELFDRKEMAISSPESQLRIMNNTYLANLKQQEPKLGMNPTDNPSWHLG